MATNGVHKISRPLKPGAFAPLPTFFLSGSEDLDIDTFQKHVLAIARAGVGVLICGSMGEAPNLSNEERIILIKAARSILDQSGLESAPIICGTGTHSTRETIKLTKDAAEAGADYSIVIMSGYYTGALANDPIALRDFWVEVAENSPIPVIIYNYPSAAGGIDLDSDLIEQIAIDSSNIAGVKLTCGNVGKLTRVAATVSVPSFAQLHPRKNPDAPFLVLGGFADFFVPSVYARAHGAITGLGNVAPRATAHMSTLAFKALANPSDPSLLAEAQHVQDIIARADRTLALAGIAGTKYALYKLYSYPPGSVAPRRPMRPSSAEAGEKLMRHPTVVALLDLEKELGSEISWGRAASLPAEPLTNGHAPENVDSIQFEANSVHVDSLPVIEENVKVPIVDAHAEDIPPAEALAESSVETRVETIVEVPVDPTVEPLVEPSIEPAVEPSIEPSVEPSVEPHVEPSVEPHVEAAAEAPAELPAEAPIEGPVQEAAVEVVPEVVPTAAVEESTVLVQEMTPHANGHLVTDEIHEEKLKGEPLEHGAALVDVSV